MQRDLPDEPTVLVSCVLVRCWVARWCQHCTAQPLT
jgi:hypothetical protein